MKALRFVWDIPLSWAFMVLYLPIIFSLWLVQVIRNSFDKKNPNFWGNKVSYRDYRDVVLDFIDKSPIYTSGAASLYVCRVPYGSVSDGKNNNTDHSALRNGVFISLIYKLFGKVPKDMIYAQNLHYSQAKDEFYRGYYFDGSGVPIAYNDSHVSGDMAIGHCFAYVHIKDEMDLVMAKIAYHCIRNQGLRTNGVVSSRGNFAPGYQFDHSETPVTVGAQHITYLAIVKCGAEAAGRLTDDIRKQNGIPGKSYFIWHYWKRLMVYGAIFSIMAPTACIRSRRAYNNDNICMMASYVLWSLSGPVMKKFYTLIGGYIWLLSWNWLNGFFSGMLYKMSNKSFPSAEYMERCKYYAHSFSDIDYSSEGVEIPNDEFPINPGEIDFGEFFGDGSQYKKIDKTKPIIKSGRSTLGQIAMTMWSSI